MIEITPEIIGPGIEEEYADALEAIDDLRIALGPQPLTNHTPEGRVLLNVMWVEQEVRARRLPIPVDESFVATIYYLVGSNELGHVPGFEEALGRLWLVLKGYGLMKSRHVPVLVSMMDDFLADAAPGRPLDAEATALLADIRHEADDLRRGGPWPKSRPPAEQFSVLATASLKAGVENCSNRLRAIELPLFEAWRPRPARKPPLSAPVAGLQAQAPRLPSELEGRLP